MKRIASRRKRRIPNGGGAARRPPPERIRAPGPADGTSQSDVPRRLSQREQEIVALLIAGNSVKEAAAALDLSPRTVEGYLERLKQRFRVPRLLALVVHLVQQGLVE